MTTAKDLMSAGIRYVPVTETLDRAAQLMREQDVGALPVTDTDGRLAGIITDRDIVIKCVSHGKDPAKMTAGDIMTAEPRSVESSASASEVLDAMRDIRVRRIPVTENGELIGMITEADVVRQLPQGEVYAFAQSIYVDR